MTQTAKVKKVIAPGLVEVAVKRVSACAHDCSKCASGGCMMMEHPDLTVKAYNGADAREGDLVLVESSSKRILSMAAVVYLLPFALLIGGYVAAAALGASENGALGVGFACFLLSFLISIALNRATKKRAVHFYITRVLNHG